MKKAKRFLAILSITLALSFTTTQSHAGWWQRFWKFWEENAGNNVSNRPPNPLGVWNW